jgi:ADP-heptose:LPS heptosyltransferase
MPLKTWIPYDTYFSFNAVNVEKILTKYRKNKEDRWIGIAPFSNHALKNWPLENMVKLMRLIREKLPARFFFFGGGKKELEAIDAIMPEFAGSVNTTRELTFDEELDLISRLDAMISMDSANMHMASLAGIKTITIWGATHPYAGFSAYHGNNALDIQISKKELECRPCSIFGKGTCHRGDFACMNWLSPEKVYQEIRKAGFI